MSDRRMAPHKDHVWLREHYVARQMTTDEVAKLAGCSTESVRRHLHRFGIPVRSRSEATSTRYGYNVTREWLVECYSQHEMSAQDIADRLGCAKTTVYQWLDAFGIRTRTKGQAKSISWKRGRYDGMFTDEVRARLSASIRAAYREGRNGTPRHRERQSRAVTRAWKRGVFDHTLVPRTRTEIAFAAALDGCGI